MNLSIAQIIAAMALWFIVGALLDLVKLLIATTGNAIVKPLARFANWINNRRIGFREQVYISRSYKLDLFFQALYLVLGLFEILDWFLISILKSFFRFLVFLVVLIFFIPYLFVKIVSRIISVDMFYQGFLENLLKSRLAGDETTDAPPPTNKKKDKSK